MALGPSCGGEEGYNRKMMIIVVDNSSVNWVRTTDSDCFRKVGIGHATCMLCYAGKFLEKYFFAQDD